MLARLLAEYPEDVRIVYRHFPLINIHDKAALAAQGSDAAGVQGQFWEMHDVLFERQADWTSLSVDEFQEWLIARAAELEMDEDQFSADLVSEANVSSIQAAWDGGAEIGIPGTPFVLLNRQIYPDNLPMDYANLSSIIELELLEKRQFTACPPMDIDPLKGYVATIQTEKGDIEVELFVDEAPIAVNSFIFLANNGWYDGVTFHRVIPGFVAQAGDPTGTGFGGPGYAFANEISPNLKFDKAGLLAMANSGPDTNGSQFFITYGPTPDLDGGYTIFGQVIAGMDVATSLTPRNPAQTLDLPPGDRILSVTIEVK